MKYIWVNQLPKHVQAEIRRDAYRIQMEWYGDDLEAVTGMTAEEIVENLVMCERLVNIIGLESEGMLDAEKYRRFMK